MDDDYNEIPLEEKIIIFTGDISSKPHIKFKKYFSFLTKVAPIANRLIITFLKIYLNNFIPTKGNHETSGNFSYCTNLNCENGNDVYSFLEEYFADKKDCFYDNYLSFIDQKILALFVKITVIKNKEILYRHFYNHSPIITEPIFSETNNKSGIKNKKELKFYASSYGENDMHNPYYSPCFLNEKLYKNDDQYELINNPGYKGFGYYSITCKISNFKKAKEFMEKTIGPDSIFKNSKYYITGGHDHNKEYKFMGESLKKNKPIFA